MEARTVQYMHVYGGRSSRRGITRVDTVVRAVSLLDQKSAARHCALLRHQADASSAVLEVYQLSQQ